MKTIARRGLKSAPGFIIFSCADALLLKRPDTGGDWVKLNNRDAPCLQKMIETLVINTGTSKIYEHGFALGLLGMIRLCARELIGECCLVRDWIAYATATSPLRPLYFIKATFRDHDPLSSVSPESSAAPDGGPTSQALVS